jgi:NADPH:quinone reductase-like Zn-dependent oxidoreductase
MVRVVRFDAPGGPEVLRFHDVDVPEAGRGEVRIKVKAIGINRADVMRRRDIHNEPITAFPAGLGNEAAGIIDSVGEGVTGFAIGDAVNIIPSFSVNRYGTYGEAILAPIHAVVKHPPSLSYEEAASIWMMFMTASSALIEDAELTQQDVVLISAASSSVGLAAIQLTNLAGAMPVALTRTNGKRQRLLDAGARHVIAAEEQDIVAEVMKITGGKGARVAFDPVGGPMFLKLMEALTARGTAYLYGALSEQVTPLPGIDFVAKLQTVKGHNIWKTSADPERQKAAVEYIRQGLASGKLKPVIDKTFAFDDIVEAHRYLETNAQFGKIVVTV